MIGKLTGTVDTIYHDSTVLFNVHDVGYMVICSGQTISALQKNACTASLLIEMAISENCITMYGFLTEQERMCFRCLKSIPGIGGRMAISVLNILSVAEIVDAIIKGNSNTFQQVSGIGHKLAIRITTELKNNKTLLNMDIVEKSSTTEETEQKSSYNNNMGVLHDAISAVIKLGFNKNVVTNVANNIYKIEKNITLEDLIKQILSALSIVK